MSITLLFLNIYLLCTVLLTGFFSVYSLSKGNSNLVKVFSASCGFAEFYLLGYLLEINSHSLGQMIFWNQIQYIGIPIYPAFWLLLSFIYTKRIKSLNRHVFMLTFIVPILTFLIRATNSIHHLYYKHFKVKSLLGFHFLAFDKGAWYLIYSVYLIISFSLATHFYIKNYSKCDSYERPGYIIMIIASLFPFIGFILILINPFHLGIDYAVLLLPISSLLILLSLFKYNFLELKTLARETLFDKSADAMILIDNNNRIMDYNYAARLLFNHSKCDMGFESIKDLLKNNNDFIEAVKTNKTKDIKIEHNNYYEYYEIKSVDIEDNYFRKAGHLITLTNITERKNAQDELNLLATTDSLTGIYNRRKFMQLAKAEMKHSIDSANTFSIIMIDVDHFKQINDTNGHIAGDTILKFLSSKMKDYFRKTDIIGRLGGEEFAIILPGTTIEDSERMAEIFRNDIYNSSVPYEDILIKFTISIGISQYSTKLTRLHDLLKLVDKALYESKSTGRNKVSVKTLK